MEFKDVVVGIEKQVNQAFTETVEEQTKVLLEEIGRSGEAFGRMFGGEWRGLIWVWKAGTNERVGFSTISSHLAFLPD